jgi:rubrerythrin
MSPHRKNSSSVQQATQQYIVASSGCNLDKRAHLTRRSAKAHARGMRGYGEHLRPYECVVCGYWHVGHLPARVIAGLTTATEHYAATRVAATFERNHR